jgi:hypothetical protein
METIWKEREEIFPIFLYLPNELLGLILCEWIGKVRELKLFDSAITNRFLRGKYYETLKQVKNVAAEASIAVGKPMQNYVDWFKRRFISTRHLHLYKLKESNPFHVLDGFYNMNNIEQLTLWSSHEVYTKIDLLMLVQRLPQLLKLRLKYIQLLFPKSPITQQNKPSVYSTPSKLHYFEIGDTKNKENELETIFSQLVSCCPNISTLIIDECSAVFPTLVKYLLDQWSFIHTLTYINTSNKLWEIYHRRVEIVEGLDERNNIQELTQSNPLWKQYQAQIESTFTATYPQIHTITINLLQYNADVHWYYGLMHWFPNIKHVTFLDNRMEGIELPMISSTFMTCKELRSLNLQYCSWTCDEMIALLCEYCPLVQELILGDHPNYVHEHDDSGDDDDENRVPRITNLWMMDEDEIILIDDEEEEEERETVVLDPMNDQEDEIPLTFTAKSFQLIATCLKDLRRLTLHEVSKVTNECIDALCEGELHHLTELTITGMYGISVERYTKLLQCSKFQLRQIQLQLDVSDADASIYKPYDPRGLVLYDDLQRATHDIFNTITSSEHHNQHLEVLSLSGFSERSETDEYGYDDNQNTFRPVTPAKLMWSGTFPKLTKLVLRYISINTKLLQEIVNHCPALSMLEIETLGDLYVDLVSFAPVSNHLHTLLLSNASSDGRVVLSVAKIEQIIVDCALLVSFYWATRDFLEADELALIKTKYNSRVCFEHPDWAEFMNHETVRYATHDSS